MTLNAHLRHTHACPQGISTTCGGLTRQMQQLRSGSGCAPEALPVESAVTSLVPRGVGGDAAAATRSASSRSNGAALGSALSIAPTSADVVSTCAGRRVAGGARAAATARSRASDRVSTHLLASKSPCDKESQHCADRQDDGKPRRRRHLRDAPGHIALGDRARAFSRTSSLTHRGPL